MLHLDTTLSGIDRTRLGTYQLGIVQSFSVSVLGFLPSNTASLTSHRMAGFFMGKEGRKKGKGVFIFSLTFSPPEGFDQNNSEFGINKLPYQASGLHQ